MITLGRGQVPYLWLWERRSVGCASFVFREHEWTHGVIEGAGVPVGGERGLRSRPEPVPAM